MAKPAFDPKKPFEVVEEKKPPFDPSKSFQVLDEPVAPGPIGAEKLETAARSALEGATFGVSEPILSGVNATIGNLIDAGFDAESLKDFFSKSIDTTRLQKEYASDVARRKGLEAELPEYAIPAEIAGAVLTGKGITKVPGAIGKVVKAIGAPARLTEAATQFAGSMVPSEILGSQKLGQYAGELVKGATSAATALGLKEAVQVPTGVASPEEFDLKQAALLGAAIPGALGATGYALSKFPGGAKKIVSALGGVSEEGIEKYLKDPQAFIRAKSPAEIKDIVDNVVSDLSQGLDEAKLSAKQAQGLLNETKQALKDEVADRVSEFKTKKFDVNLLLKDAQTKLNEAISVAKKDTEAGLDAAKNALRYDAVDAVEALKEKVISDSRQSYKILEDSGRVVSVKPAIEAAQQALDDLKIQGKPPTAGASAQSYSVIQNYLDDLKRYKNILSAKDAKKKIQQLDQDWVSSLSKGEFTDSQQKALRAIRAAFDEQLKDIPEYAAIMSQVSEQTDLLSKANKAFGNLEKATGRISRIEQPFKAEDRDLLIRLGETVKRPFEEKLGQIAQIGTELTPGVIEQKLAVSPVGKEASKLEAQLSKLKRPEAISGVKEQVMQGPLGAQVAKAQEELARRQLIADKAQQELKNLGPFARPATNISAIKTAVLNKNPEYVKYLENLTKISGEDFKSLIDDLRTAEQFNKEFRIGSRNVNLWGLGTGAAVYGLTGDPTTSLIIAGLGGGFGGLIDRFGPRMTQKILDGYLKVQGMPSIQKLEAAFQGLPPEVTNFIKEDFARSYSLAAPEDVLVDSKNAPDVIQNIQSSNLSSVEKAQMINQIQKNRPVNSTQLSSVILGRKVQLQVKVPISKQPKTLKEDRPNMLKVLDRIKK